MTPYSPNPEVPASDIVRISGTRLAWTGLREWLQCVYDLQHSYRPSSSFYGRAERLYRSLSLDHVRACDDLRTLDEFEHLVRDQRYGDAPLRYGLARVHRRPQLGLYIVEASNRRRNIKDGCGDREKGPRFDPRYIPDHRLESLIQSHPDLHVVEALRAERECRLQARAISRDSDVEETP